MAKQTRKRDGITYLESPIQSKYCSHGTSSSESPPSFQETLLQIYLMNGANPRTVLAISNGVVKNERELWLFAASSGQFSNMNWSDEATVIKQSLLHHTHFKRKHGYPQLLSAAADAVRTNNDAWAAASGSITGVATSGTLPDSRMGELLCAMRMGRWTQTALQPELRSGDKCAVC